MRLTTRRLLRPVAVMATVLAALTFSVASAGARSTPGAPAPASPVQQTEALAKPSVVFIRTDWQGWITSARWGGIDVLPMMGSGSFKVTTTCSGFIANPDGYVMTAAHCVDDQSVSYGGRGLIIQAAVAYLVKKYDLSDASYRSMLATGYAYWKVEGQDSGSPPERVVGVFPVGAVSGISVTKGVQANVVDFQSFKKGDVALLKIASSTPLPALQVAPTAPAEGSQVIAMGYPGSVSDTVDPSSNPSMKDGTVSGSKTVAGVPFTEVSASTSSGMSGGPVVDLKGQVVGLVSWSPGSETQSFNFITATSSVSDLLGRNNVRTALTATDRTYRTGLTDYFGGRYHAAAKEFEKVLQLEPDHAGAQEYHRLAVANYPYDKASKGSSNALLYSLIGGGVLLAALVVGGFLFLRRRRHGGAAATGAPLAMPSPVGPSGMAPQPVATAAPSVPAAPSAPAAPAGLGGPWAYEPAVPPEGYYSPPPGAGGPQPPAAPVPPPVAPAPPAPPAAPVAEMPVATTEPVAETPVAGTPVAEVPGQPHAQVYCPFCGEPHEPNAHFCASCGFHFPSSLSHSTGAGEG